MGRLALSLAGWIALTAVAVADEVSTGAETLPLKVTVTGAGGTPAAGVEVYANAFPPRQTPSATTDSEGLVTLNIAPKQVSGLTVYADDGQNMGQVQLPWTQELPESLKPVSIELAPARTMKVRVVDESGTPVGDATVLLQSSFRDVFRGTTDQQGRAALRVPHSAPRQTIVAMKPGLGLDYFAFTYPGMPKTDPNLLPPTHDEPIELVLNGSREVIVEVVDQDGNPLAGAKVYPWLYLKPDKGADLNLSGMPEFQYTTDDSGRCTFEVPADLSRVTTIWARMEGYSATERANYDPKSLEPIVQATLVQMVSLSGKVALPEGVQGSDITINIAGDGHGFDNFRQQSVAANDDGSFEVLVSRNMYYQLVAGDNKQWASPGVNLVVLDQDLDGVRLRLVPATRVHGRAQMATTGEPVSNSRLRLNQKTINSYYELPDSEKIPNPTDSRLAISPGLGEWTQTDAEGKFEFFVGPGSYYLSGLEMVERPSFVVGGETEKEVLVQVTPRQFEKDRIVKGRVLLAGAAQQPVAAARVFSYPLDGFSGQHIRAVGDAEGWFETRLIGGPHYLHASATVDGKRHAGIARITPDDEIYEVSIAPAAKLIGRFIDEELDVPLENRKIRCAIHIEYPDGISTEAFGGSATTDEHGNFEIDGLVVGRTYRLTVTVEVDADGSGRSFGYAGEVTPTKPGTFEQEFHGSALDFPPTFTPIGQ
ncbi:hypothetical protein NG895_29925 [Aeoliella sp. ICT_H6.2]|uniref:Nickel uptake substrate-specific transmembrane region n=1 Tax=Aeoliella straminimaris TaxID=2954799 RepID=A0A9X2JL49_9BACT|nr:hypothetical protein [Aeoliella straminimaris]MCO6048134.1 hypothetical protein [Aeoliella straminimaris]